MPRLALTGSSIVASIAASIAVHLRWASVPIEEEHGSEQVERKRQRENVHQLISLVYGVGGMPRYKHDAQPGGTGEKGAPKVEKDR